MSSNPRDEEVELPGDDGAQQVGRARERSSDKQGVELPGDEDPHHISGKGG